MITTKKSYDKKIVDFSKLENFERNNRKIREYNDIGEIEMNQRQTPPYPTHSKETTELLSIECLISGAAGQVASTLEGPTWVNNRIKGR